MFKIRAMTVDDIPAGLALCRLSRWNQVARDWEQFLALNPDSARVAVADTQVIATVTTLDYNARFGWVAMVLVDPAHRGQGLGTAMLTTGLQLLEHVPVVRLDATPAGYPIYRTRGFEEEYQLVRMERAAAAPPAPAPKLPLTVRRMTSADRAAVARSGSGGIRRAATIAAGLARSGRAGLWLGGRGLARHRRLDARPTRLRFRSPRPDHRARPHRGRRAGCGLPPREPGGAGHHRCALAGGGVAGLARGVRVSGAAAVHPHAARWHGRDWLA